MIYSTRVMNMYIEVFLLDNAVMDFLTLRTAQAALGRGAPVWRLALASALGACYSLMALRLPMLTSLPMKIASGMLMAFAFAPKDVWGFLKNALAVFMAALITGGAVTALAYSLGGGMENGRVIVGLPLRSALYGAALASMLPKLVRKVFARRIDGKMRVKLILTHGGFNYKLTALIDTGNTLTEPLFSLPAAVIYAPELSRFASLPIPFCTLSGSGELLGFIPDFLAIQSGNETQRLQAVVALSPSPISGADALLPVSALPY